MPQYYERLLEELKYVTDKTNKLVRFYDNEQYKNLDKFQKALLVSQENAMRTYARILESRIEYEKELLIKRGYKPNDPN